MAKILDGIVVENDLFLQYHAFQNNGEYDWTIVNALLHFFKKSIVAPVEQYAVCGVALPKNQEVMLRKCGLKGKSLEELALLHTPYKVVLSTSKNHYPYINILNQPWLENNYSHHLYPKDPRDKAQRHLKDLCAAASKISIYDAFLDAEGVKLLGKILPRKRLEIACSGESPQEMAALSSLCPLWSVNQIPHQNAIHDRYLEIDGQTEVIISSGFRFLQSSQKDCSYIVRHKTRERF
ncbi:MAG: hypothetical protein LIO90_04350 [Bacteroidales bacterium]|nr:hypothetical protein [Bacteroidales bacterium]